MKILLIDNYDSFTYNLYHYLSKLKCDVDVCRNDKISINQIIKKKSLLDTMLAGFPAGTVTGAPKIRAMEIIDQLEKSKRKMYAGSIGYFSANKNFDTCIALRTALIKNNKFYIQSGAGIVADSVPEKEYLETINKAKALINSLN